MSRRAKAAAAGVAIVVVAVAAFFLLVNRAGPLGLGAPDTCPLTGREAEGDRASRPAVAVKIENNPVAYPLSGLDRAEVVYEELVEGGLTRFMAIYHCTDARKAGPVRSARVIDPAIMTPTTRILAFAGSNDVVARALEEAEIVELTENNAGNGLRRVERPGITSEHTLYGNTPVLRRIGSEDFDDPPPGEIFEFGDLNEGARRARKITINFSAGSTIEYVFKAGKYRRFQDGDPFIVEGDRQIAVENVLIEEHDVQLSTEIRDVVGNPSIEIADSTGSGRAVLFRNGRAIEGRWRRESLESAVEFETRAGDKMLFAPGVIWVELVPSERGEVRGSFSYAR